MRSVIALSALLLGLGASLAQTGPATQGGILLAIKGKRKHEAEKLVADWLKRLPLVQAERD